jgi:RND family efflux transporter MFP subunit
MTMSENALTSPPPSSNRGLLAGMTLVIIVAVVVVFLLWSRRSASAAHETAVRSTVVSGGSTVRTVSVVQSNPIHQITLLGEAKPFAAVTVYAKVSGYLQSIHVDVGDRVAAGQVIATIESPETDRALAGAKVDYDNKEVSAKRVAQLLERKYVSPQEADQARTEASVARERVAALAEQQRYETLRAPLTGTVTARFADPGALMQSAASSQTSALPVVTIAETERLRVLAYLDQADAAVVRKGARVTITLTERPDVRIPGTVARSSGELDPRTRKMLVEVDVDNRNGAIVSGSLVQVQVDVPTESRPQAPAEALVVRGGKTMVAIVRSDGTVHFQDVSVASNDGKTILFGGGVAVGDRLALNLGSSVADGARVRLDSAR